MQFIIPITTTINKFPKQLPRHHMPWDRIMGNGTKDENITNTKNAMSWQQIITFGLVMTYAIASRAMNRSFVAKL